MNGTNKDGELRKIEAQELGDEKGCKRRINQEMVQYIYAGQRMGAG